MGTKLVLVKLIEPEAEMNLWKVLDRLHSFCKRGEGVNAALPNNEPVLIAENVSQMVNKHDRSTKSEDLNVKDWPLESSFNVVYDFLNSMTGNSCFTEPEKELVSLFSIVVDEKVLPQWYQYSDLSGTEPKAIDSRAADEISVVLARSNLRKVKLVARSLAQLQSIMAAVHVKNAAISIPNDAEV